MSENLIQNKVADICAQYDPLIVFHEEEKNYLRGKNDKDSNSKRIFLSSAIEDLKKRKREEILQVYRSEGLVADNLKKLNEMTGKNFKGQTCNFGTPKFQEAISEDSNEFAYYCNYCRAWIVDYPLRATIEKVPSNFEVPSYYFCKICGRHVGVLLPTIKRFLNKPPEQ